MAKKRGRPKLPDLPQLRHVFEDDARFWLSGGDPFERRTIYAIAKEFTDANPGHNAASTMDRIEAKLRESRRVLLFVTAEKISRNGYPFAAHLRAVEALKREAPSLGSKFEADAANAIRQYREKLGAEPPAGMSISEIGEAGKRPDMQSVQTWMPVGPIIR